MSSETTVVLTTASQGLPPPKSPQQLSRNERDSVAKMPATRQQIHSYDSVVRRIDDPQLFALPEACFVKLG